jgi:ATP-dependent Clp protease ATP-binding subunit ClpC
MGTLVAGTKYRGEFEARMKSILEEAMDPTNNIILFIDEIHTIIGAGGQENGDAAQMLKPLLSRGKIKLIGSTTFNEYQKYIEKDAALKRRFQEVVVNEPDIDMTKEILMGLRQTYEDFHGVKLTDEALDIAINLSKRYIMNKYLPDKALDIIDEACARKSTMNQKLDNDKDYKKYEETLAKIQKKIEEAIEKQDYFGAAELKAKEEEAKLEMQKIRNNKNIPTHLRPIITKEDIGNVLADKTGIPTNIVNESEIEKLRRLGEELKKNII